MAGHTAEPFGESFSVAMEATRADLAAAAHGIPCRVGPLDL